MPKQKQSEGTGKGKAEKADKPKASDKKLCAVLIRSSTNFNPDIKKTLENLKLRKKHVCVVVEDNPSNRGMMKRAKDAITWGEIDEETIKELDSKRGNDSNFYNLHPPRGGYERKGIKVPFRRGGALGYRGEDMNKLVRKML